MFFCPGYWYSCTMDKKTLIKEIDIHLLDTRYSHTRIKSVKALTRMRHSIATYGQLVPALVVSEPDRFILIDGYLRLNGLRYCGHDCIKVRIGEGEPDSLFHLLAENNERHLEVIEQAALIQELHNRFDCSFDDIAKRLGKDKSWVKRRLDLVESLPEKTRRAVMNGKVSSWAASRVLAPLARANEHDCSVLTKKLMANPLSTRELVCLYDHYKKANRTIRDRIIADPSLFIKTLRQQEEQKEGEQINQGPEGKWFKDINIVCHILKRLQNFSGPLFYQTLDNQKRQQCRSWLVRAEKIIIELKEQTKRKNYDNTGIPTDHSGDGEQGNGDTGNQPYIENIQEHCQECH